jgi:hypothetical protein
MKSIRTGQIKSISGNALSMIFLQPNMQSVTKFFLLFFCFFLFAGGLVAQVQTDSNATKLDTLVHAIKKHVAETTTVVKKLHPPKLVIDSAKPRDTVKAPIIHDTVALIKPTLVIADSISLFRIALSQNSYYNFLGKMQYQEIEWHQPNQMDGLFYLLLALSFYFAFIKVFFDKYFSSLLSLFFRASMRQQQMRDQAQQMPLASLFLNILFVITAGYFLSFVIRYEHYALSMNFWLLTFYCIALVGLIYIGKFCLLVLAGWIFNVNKAASSYIFTVFMVNKIAGIILLPIIIILTYSSPLVNEVIIAISIFVLTILLIYRLVAGFSALRGEIKLSLFHYFVYLCAFEIAPLLLIYKVAMAYLKKAY